MTTAQKIARLTGRIARLRVQAKTQVDRVAAVVVPPAVDGLDVLGNWIDCVIVDEVVVPAAPAQGSTSYYSYFASSISNGVSRVAKAVTVSATSFGGGVAAVPGLAKQAATAVCWTAPRWLMATTVRCGAYGVAGVVGAAPVAKAIGLYGLQFALVLSAIVVVGSVLFSPFGLSMVIVGCGVGFFNYLEIAREERRAAYYAERYAS